jgi:hypothetical protein
MLIVNVQRFADICSRDDLEILPTLKVEKSNLFSAYMENISIHIRKTDNFVFENVNKK